MMGDTLKYLYYDPLLKGSLEKHTQTQDSRNGGDDVPADGIQGAEIEEFSLCLILHWQESEIKTVISR